MSKRTVNLGEPYEKIIKKVIEEGRAATPAEVLRQALTVYDEYLDEERENELVCRRMAQMEADRKSGKTKTYTHEEVGKMLGIDEE